MRARYLVVAVLMPISTASFAAAGSTRDAPPATATATHRWSVEINALQPFFPTVHIIRPKLTWTLWGPSGGVRGDLVVGAYIRPHIEHDIVHTIDEYMGTVGYRQYAWRGLHVEALINAGAAWGTNRFDGERYRTPSVFVDVNAGYRFGFFEPGGFYADRANSVSFFVTVQGGVLFSVGIADIGPRDGKPDWFPQGDLLLGVSF